MTDNGNFFLDFTDADLKAALARAFKTTAVLGVVLAIVLAIAVNWQTGLLLMVGAAISSTGLWEWQRLVAVINARLDKQRATGAARVVIMFFLRLLLAGALLYASLKCLHGSIYALVGGLGLAVLVLAIEVVRLIRS
ncbi:MAG TPA: ATP synthase subunit I [Pseudacidobacterium sp.]|nr:ATP synthase subunit I [Pseudacidobacterium sp.]